MMADRRIGSAIVIDPDADGIGIMTERDVLPWVPPGRGGRAATSPRALVG
jgi:hypothetical protein